MALNITKEKAIPILKTAWYQKNEATFSDVIALVRRHIWSSRKLVKSSGKGHFTYFDSKTIGGMLEMLRYGL